MKIRPAADRDVATLGTLWEEFTAEATFTPYAPAGFDANLVRNNLAFVADDHGAIVGTVYANVANREHGYVFGLYVRPEARRRGVAKALLDRVAGALSEQGRRYVVLDVDTPNTGARAVYDRLGFTEIGRRLLVEVGPLRTRIAGRSPGRSFGSIHVQSDDAGAVERAIRQFVPRLPGRSRGSLVAPPRNGWVAVYDDVCDRDPAQLRRLARELSDRMGAVVLALGVEDDAVVRFVLLDRGSVVDEYLSVQEYYGPLPPGDVIALAANPRVVSRLTGADPAVVRAAALHAASPAELPPPRELLERIASALGIEGAGHGWEDAPDVPRMVRVDRA